MQDQKCRWKLESKPKYDPLYECRGDPLPNDPDGYCILHSEDEAKDLKKEFTDKVTSRIIKTANKEEIDLIGCYFPKCFDTEFFKGRTFKKHVNFNSAKFAMKKIDFSEAKFLQGAKFYRVKFSERVFFSKTSFEGQMTTFREAEFNDVEFDGTLFRGEEVSFSDTRFTGKPDFDAPHFYGQVYFLRTQFKKYCKFRWIEIRTTQPPIFEDVNLFNCSFLHSNIDKVDFRYCDFAKVKGRQNVLKDELDCDKAPNKDYEPVRRLYLELKKNFEDKKDWNTAGDFHYGEMECRRKMKGWLWRNILSIEALYYWASGYGERPWRAGFWMMLLILVCALFYMPSTDKASPSPQVSGRAGQTLVETASQEPAGNTMQGHPATPDLPAEGCSGRACSTFKRYLEGLNTSLRVTARLDTEKTEEKGWLRTIQSILGPILIALFFLALRRKVKR